MDQVKRGKRLVTSRLACSRTKNGCWLRPGYPARSCSSSAGEPVTRSRSSVARKVERSSPSVITTALADVAGPTYIVKAGGGLYRLIPAAMASFWVPTSLRPWTVLVVPAEVGSLSASADERTLAFVQTACRGPDQQIGIIRGCRMKT
jgi:hypothetical protein